MQTTLTNEPELVASRDDRRTFQLVLDPGEEAVERMSAFAIENGVTLASFTAIGGFEDFSLGFYDLATGGFDEIPFHADQVEVLSLMGEITRWDDGTPRVHGHVVVGRRDGTTRGGHLLRGVVRPILIVALQELGSHHGVDHHDDPQSQPSMKGTA